jgi:ribosomal protein S18 acetylase RimI-like enzyme
MVELSRSVSLPRNLRRMNPLRDWGAVTRLMQVAFQTDVTNPGLPLLPDQAWLRWLRPVLSFVEAIGMDAPEQMLGFVWEADGGIVGNATLGLASAQGGIWLLSNVAVHPAYRRRGIARALVDAAIAETRAQGGRWLTLQVQSDNRGARDLYDQTGFRSLESVSEFAGLNVTAGTPVPRAARLVRPTPEQWQATQALAAAHLPEPLRLFRHALSGMFHVAHRRNPLEQLADLALATHWANWSLLWGEQVAGGLVVQTQLSWGAHRVAAWVAPVAQGRVEELLIAQAIDQTRHFASRRMNVALPASYTALADALSDRGLREMRTLELMGIAL